MLLRVNVRVTVRVGVRVTVKVTVRITVRARIVVIIRGSALRNLQYRSSH